MKVVETRGSGGYRSRSLTLAASFPFFSLTKGRPMRGWIDDRGSISFAAWIYQRIVDFTRVKMKKNTLFIVYTYVFISE